MAPRFCSVVKIPVGKSNNLIECYQLSCKLTYMKITKGNNMENNKPKVSWLHKDITYTTRENGDVSGLQFHSDEGREKFAQMQMLNVLKAEATNTMGLRFYRGSIINRLKRYFPDLPRTRKGAYKYLVKHGYYDWDNS
jgi:hypothetical protein